MSFRKPACLTILIWMAPVMASAQYYFDFENDTSGMFGTCLNIDWDEIPAGRWECSTESAIEGGSSLHHGFDNPESGCDWVILTHNPPGEGDSLSLSFRVRHGYAPSSLNNWQVALLARIDTAGEVRIEDGLVLGVNFEGSDDLVKIWLCEPGNVRELCTTTLNYQEHVGTLSAPQFRLDMYPDGMIHLYCRLDPQSDPYERIGSCQRYPLPAGRQLAIRYEYSSARDRSLWLDEIAFTGKFQQDTFPPFVREVKVVDAHHLLVVLSEEPEQYNSSSFCLTGPGGKDIYPEYTWLDRAEILLEFRQQLPNRVERQLMVSGICDGDGNCLQDTLISIMRNEAVWGDVVLNELMADPLPAVLLSGEEYIELYNRSGFDVTLEEWRLMVNQRTYQVPSSVMPPTSFMVLHGVPLPNEGAVVALYSGEGTLVHAASYSEPWDGPGWKSEGGWSQESPEPDLVCRISELWQYSADPAGGTPGRLNSCDTDLADLEPPRFLYHGFGEDTGSVVLHFSEPVHFKAPGPEDARVDPGDIRPDSTAPLLPLADQWVLWFNEELPATGSYTLTLPAPVDCAGNPGSPLLIRSGKPAGASGGVLLINEIMYDPLEGAPEYVELYNPGPGYADLREFALDVVDEGTLPVFPVPLSDHSRIVIPGEYLLITGNLPALIRAYGLDLSGNWVEVREMGVLPNSGGRVLLTDRSGEVLEMAQFGDHMHMELVGVTCGVSLERISAERAAGDPSNWHSAASLEGYCTPGRENSQSQKRGGSTRWIEVDPEVISPDNDGLKDLLGISVSFPGPGWVMTIRITDLRGRPVRILADNHLVGPEAVYSWDGEGENGRMVSGGIYILHAQGYHPETGEKRDIRKAVGVIYR